MGCPHNHGNRQHNCPFAEIGDRFVLHFLESAENSNKMTAQTIEYQIETENADGHFLNGGPMGYLGDAVDQQNYKYGEINNQGDGAAQVPVDLRFTAGNIPG